MTIAFCFLTYDVIVRHDIWNLFFKNIDIEKYRVFIHPKNILQQLPVGLGYLHPSGIASGLPISSIPDAEPLDLPKVVGACERLYQEKYTFPYQIVKNRIITNRKDNINIVRATLRLLEETYKYDDKITHFIFLSQSCIPLYNFDKLYSLIKLFPNSVISSIDNNQKNRYGQLSDNIKKYINYNNFVKQQPNMILVREDVEKLIKDDLNLTQYFQYMICPDEHYFINVLNNIFKKKIIKRQTHFCNHDLQKTQGLEFYNIDKKLIDKIRNYGFLFMRKANNMSVIENDYLFF